MEQNLDSIEDKEQAERLSLKINAVIDRLINKESVLIVSQDHQEKMERGLSLNINYNAPLI